MTSPGLDYCHRVTKASGSNFYYSFLALPKAQREAIYAVYAFTRLIDDAVDETKPTQEAKALLTQWRKEIAQCYAGAPTHPVTQGLAEVLTRFPIPQDYFQDVVSGVEMDLYHKRYDTFSDLRQYCYRVASVIGLICIEIFGYRRKEIKDYAINQGIAFQLTNILRDIPADAMRGRIYIPLDELKGFHYPETDLLSGRYTDAFMELMKFQCQRARDYYHKAQALIMPEDRPSLVASEIMGAIYSKILERIERANYNVFQKRISLSAPHKAVIALSAWLRNRFSS